jgi:rubredoxin
MSKVTIVNKSKPKQVQVPVADIPKMQFGDLLGWFERMAFERGDHPCVLARMPKVLEAAGVDPKSLSPTVLAKAVTATLPLAESYFRRSNLDPETNGNGRWPPGQFSRIVWLGQAIPSAPEMKCAFCGTEFRPTGNSTQMTGFKHLDPVYSCPKCGMGLNAATHAKSVVAEGPARVPLAGAHGTELRNDPQPGHGWKVGGISVERRGKTASGSPKYRVMGRRATKIIQWFGHDAWTVPDVMGALTCSTP